MYGVTKRDIQNLHKSLYQNETILYLALSNIQIGVLEMYANEFIDNALFAYLNMTF